MGLFKKENVRDGFIGYNVHEWKLVEYLEILSDERLESLRISLGNLIISAVSGETNADMNIIIQKIEQEQSHRHQIDKRINLSKLADAVVKITTSPLLKAKK